MSSTAYNPAFLKLPLELLREICRELVVQRFSDIHLAKVALTCRALYLAANPILWERIPGLEPLLKLMPRKSWDKASLNVYYDAYKASKSASAPNTCARPVPDFWAPIRELANRVKYIDIYPIPWARQKKILQANPTHKLLPNVDTVRLTQDKARLLLFSRGSVDYYCHFLKFILSFSHVTVLSMDNAHRLATRQAHFPRLSSLTRDGDLPSKSVVDALQQHPAQLQVVQSLTSHRLLGHLDIYIPFGPHPELFEGLARLRRLAFLRVEFRSIEESGQSPWIERRPKYPAGAFPALEVLHVYGVPFADAAALLQSCPRRPLLNSVYVDSPETEPPANVLALTETIERVCDPAYIQDVVLCRRTSDAQFNDAAYQWTLTYEHIAPLASISGLKSFGLGNFWRVHFTQEQWTHLARSWPDLFMLEMIITAFYGPTTTCCSLATLATLAAHCPALTRIYLPFEATTIPLLPAPPNRPATDAEVVRIVLGDPKDISNAQEVAVFLQHVFGPGVRVDLGYELDEFDKKPELERRDKEWQKVMSLTSGTRGRSRCAPRGLLSVQWSEQE
ncbi:uncharacterized protein SCHCODRAFT_02693331 [Schizophyllum commune H4-8]|nr:uncharacterized protein SCHCODRAFT_02693331 [Schizophyllum commune H4-8]KAI5886636.1 hypothetical protein SCHCODRAFT_02693331 [Schizophyllum commune H4-8]